MLKLHNFIKYLFRTPLVLCKRKNCRELAAFCRIQKKPYLAETH